MANIFLHKPNLFDHKTRVETLRQAEDGRFRLALAENIFRPAGGGQPQDQGRLAFANLDCRVARIFKDGGQTWIELDDASAARIGPGDFVEQRVDAEYRTRLSQCHSLIHVLMAAIRNVMTGYESKGAVINHDGQTMELRFRSSAVLSPILTAEFDILTRHLMARDVPIRVTKARSIEQAKERFRLWRLDPEVQLSGTVRVIDIEGVDQNPCSGSHVASTGAIGPYAIRGYELDSRGVNLLKVVKTPTWMNWYGEGALELCGHVNLGAFAK